MPPNSSLPSFPNKLEYFPILLAEVRVLEQFEGTLLSEHISNENEVYIEKFADLDKSTFRTIVIKTTRVAIKQYLNQKISLLSLMSDFNEGFCYIIDRTEVNQEHAYYKVNLTEVPISYFPTPEGFHNKYLRPSDFKE